MLKFMGFLGFWRHKRFERMSQKNSFKAISQNEKKKAFTLAEVLITLGIIGVVAALTIPTLITNYKKKVIETRLETFYSIMAQAVKLSENDNGPKEAWTSLEYARTRQQTLNWYNEYLANYLTGVRVVNDPEDSVGIDIYFQNGSSMYFKYTGISFFPYSKDMARPWGATGVKRFVFHFYPTNVNNDSKWRYHENLGFEPYKFEWDGTRDDLINNRNYGCKNNGTFCTTLIQKSGWKIPSDYPRKIY